MLARDQGNKEIITLIQDAMQRWVGQVGGVSRNVQLLCFLLYTRRQKEIVAPALFHSAVNGNKVGREREEIEPTSSDSSESANVDLFTILDNGDDVNPEVSVTMTSL